MKTSILIILKTYKLLISPTLVVLFGCGCKFEPTCSEYAKLAIQKYGALQGSLLTLLRMSKCHPLNHSSHLDPVPNL